MKTIKIYGDEYELVPQASTAIDGYYYKGELFDESPGKGKLIGYAQMLDGSTVACYKAFNPFPIIIPLMLLLLIGGGTATYFFVLQPKDVYVGSSQGDPNGTPVQIGTDNLLVQYDGFMRINYDGNLEINFQNGAYPCFIEVSGEGISTQSIPVEPEQFITTIPINFNTKEGVVAAKIKITTNSSTEEFDCVIEVPENNTTDSDTEDNSMTGYWRGEYIIGVTVEDIPDNE